MVVPIGRYSVLPETLDLYGFWPTVILLGEQAVYEYRKGLTGYHQLWDLECW